MHVDTVYEYMNKARSNVTKKKKKKKRGICIQHLYYRYMLHIPLINKEKHVDLLRIDRIFITYKHL
jgi:hypothetical protein